MEIHGLQRRLRHLLALATARRCLCLGLLTVMLPERGIHITFHIGSVLKNVANHSFLDRPPEEIQLSHSGLLNRRLTAHLEADALTAAEGIKESLRIRLELALVVEVHGKWCRCLRETVRDVVLLAVVRDEPIDKSQTDGCRAGENRHDLLESPRLVVEILEPTYNEILFALNAALLSLSCGVHSC